MSPGPSDAFEADTDADEFTDDASTDDALSRAVDGAVVAADDRADVDLSRSDAFALGAVSAASLDAVTALQGHLLELATVSLGDVGFEDALVRVAHLATRSIPGADGTGLALREPAEAFDTLVATQTFVADVDAAQYRLGQGPCIDAVADNTTVCSGSLSDDDRWASFGPAAAELGVESVLSLPLQIAEQVIGSLNVYSRDRHAFDLVATELGETFAALAAVAVQNAQALAQSQRVVEQLHVALVDGAVVDQAVGVLVYRHRVDEERALRILRDRGRYEHATVQEVAQTVVDEALARGHRHPEAGDTGPIPITSLHPERIDPEPS